jgi:hypothetical protein
MFLFCLNGLVKNLKIKELNKFLFIHTINKKSSEVSSKDFPYLSSTYRYLTAFAESIFILMLSGLAVFVVMVSVEEGDTLRELFTAVESLLLVDMEDSFVPQLVANIPTVAINNNFLIILCFGVYYIKSNFYSE